MQTRLATKTRLIVALLVTISFGQASSKAAFVLTPAGLSRGLSVTTFASGFPPSGTIGPLGMAFLPDGAVLVTDYAGNIRRFASDIDNQNASVANIVTSYGSANAADIAQVGNAIYMTQQANGQVVQINNDGTLKQVIVSGVTSATGIVASPTTGHLFVSTIGNNAVIDLNPITKTFRTLVSGNNIDGLSISADGSILYGANDVTGHILGWRTSDGVQVYDSGFINGGVDGTAFGAGPLAGNVYVNTNSGTLVEVNLATSVQTLIGSGGSRGDFVTVDPTNNTLLLTQSDQILRITGPFQNNTPVVPVPPTFVLLALGSVILGARRFRDLKSRLVCGA